MRITLWPIVFLLNAGAALAQPLDPDAGNAALEAAAEKARQSAAQLDFETFRDQTLYVPETGKYIVDGDVAIRNEKLLREFYEQNVRRAPERPTGEVVEFAIMNVGGLDQVWSNADKRRLSYCVSTTFGSQYNAVIADMAAATAAWEAVADLDFFHVAGEDLVCDAANQNVMFDVRPVNAGGRFLAAAFFPNDPRADRSVVIDPSSFNLDPNDNLTLRGILRHELGHVIGARHEHTRPQAGRCFEDDNWRGVTDYDAFSVMHYPQCNGLGDWSLRLTATDQSGVACIYGAAAGFVIDPTICAPAGGAAVAKTDSFGPTTIAQGEIVMIGSFPVVPGTPFQAEMRGDGATPGDPDLYVKFDGPPLISNYDCRPFNDGADELCTFDVPADRTTANVAVHGFQDGAFTLSVTRTEP